MAKRKNQAAETETSAATVGYEAQLWQMADALRGSMDAAEYKHVVLGLIFLKYISDAFQERYDAIKKEPRLGHLALLKQSRLSVMPIDEPSWTLIYAMGGGDKKAKRS